MKYIVNILIFFIMIYSLTVMPIDMKALQVDVSWEKYKTIEAKKETQKQQEEITETVKSNHYTLSYTGSAYVFNPETLNVTLEGDEKLVDLKSDVMSKLTLAFKNKLTGEEQVFSVPANAISESTFSPGQTSLPFTINLSALTQIPSGQYTLSVESKSALTTGVAATLDVSWMKNLHYVDPRSIDLGSSFVTYYYPTTDLSQLIPVTEHISKDRILRKMATHLMTGTTTDGGLKAGQLVPKIRNIQLKAGKLSLYFKQADIDACAQNGITKAMMVDILSKTYFSLDYISEINLFVDNKLANKDLTADEAATPIVKDATLAQNTTYFAVASNNSIFFVPGGASATLDNLATQLTSAQPQLAGKKAFSPIPSQVTLAIAQNPDDVKTVTVNLTFKDKLLAGNPELTRLMLDYISQNVKLVAPDKQLTFTVNGQVATELNGVPLASPYDTPNYLNVIAQ